MGRRLETLDTQYVNVVVKIGDGKNPMPTIVSKFITTDSMAIYVGMQKVFRAYYANKLLTMTIAHDSTMELGQIFWLATGEPELDTYWELIGKQISFSFGILEDVLTLQSKRGEKRK